MGGRGRPRRPCHQPRSSSMLSRPLMGLVAGALLGVLDGLSALVSSPEVKDQIMGIVMGSSLKGVLAGVIIGLIARKLRSPITGLVIGTLVALVITAPIAYLNATQYGQPSYYWKIMLPGSFVGAIVGFVVTRWG